ncbi:MAG: hypothetical protein JO140_01795 [Candidatus Eremiobacteraeota bacterium]|nr:hypothetical protein [Candidatus Eremiobacteraeota bacterium]
MHRRYYIVALALALGLIFFAPAGIRRSDAMPVFAQAYGLDCKVCHTMVPALNAYGRYVQRSMYGALDPEQYKGTFPFWIGEQVNYDSTSDSPKAQFGNLAAHYVGVYPAWTSHVQQWIMQNNDTGGPFDTGWVSYNNLFKQSGHIVIGKMPTPGPSFLSMWFDIAGFNPPAMTIGEHAELVGANRWGAKFNYSNTKMVGEAGTTGAPAI